MRALSQRNDALLRRAGLEGGIPNLDDALKRIQGRIEFLRRAAQPLRQKELIRRQMETMRKPAWNA